jgi:hypothetical protein
MGVERAGSASRSDGFDQFALSSSVPFCEGVDLPLMHAVCHFGEIPEVHRGMGVCGDRARIPGKSLVAWEEPGNPAPRMGKRLSD